jgi:hypothetical protein
MYVLFPALVLLLVSQLPLRQGVGAVLVGAVLVGLLSSMISRDAVSNPVITAELRDEVNLTNLNFMSDVVVKERLATTSATPEQMTEALRINGDARIQALKIGFLLMSALSLLAIMPCSWLPDYKPGEIPGDRAKPGKQLKTA